MYEYYRIYWYIVSYIYVYGTNVIDVILLTIDSGNITF